MDLGFRCRVVCFGQGLRALSLLCIFELGPRILERDRDAAAHDLNGAIESVSPVNLRS
jgi:hypothetical protein